MTKANLHTYSAGDALRPQIQDLSTDTIAELARLASQLGNVLPLWYGEGDMVTPAFIGAAAKQAIDDGVTFYIPDMKGYPPLTEALAAYQTRIHGIPIGYERSTVTPGGMQALYLGLSAIIDLGQNVIVPEPQWPNIKRAIHMVGGEARTVPMTYSERTWHLDLDRLFAAADHRTRAIVLSTPSNPLGWTASLEELRALLDFGRAHGIWIISDECYNRLYFGEGGIAPSILRVAEPDDLVMTVNTFSKAWAMTGWRVGWLSHPPAIGDKIAAMTQYMNSGTPGIMQAAARAALVDGEPLAKATMERCRTGRDLAYEKLRGLDLIELPEKPPGGMYVFFSLKGIDSSTDACRQVLETARVGLAPGHLFGKPAERFLRMCVCKNSQQLEIALDRMAKALA
ncbi:MAG: pyridoxal phosphate-dependent aminotransferase [Hyphomicrobiaceae bacterium]